MKLFSRFGRVGCISPSAEYVTVNQEMEKIIPATSNFGFSLLQQCRLENPHENIVFSPFSIATVLAMTACGAQGQSKTQIIGGTLNMSEVADGEIEQIFQSVLKDTTSDSSNCLLKIANAVFADKSVPLLENYVKIVRENFRGKHKILDFEDKKDESLKTINSWVKEATGKKIRHLILEEEGGGDDDSLFALSRTRAKLLLLANVIYFKGSWKQQFDPNRTFKSPFHISSQETTEVDMMHLTSDFGYAMNIELQCSCVELPYVGDKLSMIIILPDEVDGIGTLEAKLNMELLNLLLHSMIRQSDIQLYLPKFKVEATLSLESTLTKLGLVDIFGSNSDLSAMSDCTDLRVSAILHKTFIEVNEEGTEAAAAGSSMIRFACAVIPTEIVVNHPFLLLVRDIKTGNIIFLGSIRKL